MAPAIAGFSCRRLPVAEGVSLNAAVSGSGTPIVLPHGFPRTHLMWRHVAADLAADYRACAGIDHDREAGNRLPVTVLQQDWGAALGVVRCRRSLSRVTFGPGRIGTVFRSGLRPQQPRGGDFHRGNANMSE